MVVSERGEESEVAEREERKELMWQRGEKGVVVSERGEESEVAERGKERVDVAERGEKS